MIKLGKWITKHRVIILIVAVVLLIPSVLGMIATRINYDMLNYLPDTMETIQGQGLAPCIASTFLFRIGGEHYGNHTGSGHSAE